MTSLEGDCFLRACAYLLNLDLNDVPHFVFEYEDNWFEEFNNWLMKKYNYFAIIWGTGAYFSDMAKHMKGHYIAGVITKKDSIHHVVIMENEQIIFDSAYRVEEDYTFDYIITLHPHITNASYKEKE